MSSLLAMNWFRSRLHVERFESEAKEHVGKKLVCLAQTKRAIVRMVVHRGHAGNGEDQSGP